MAPPTDPVTLDGWWQATSPTATFGFYVDRGVVTVTAPYGRRWLYGRTLTEAGRQLRIRGFTKATQLREDTP